MSVQWKPSKPRCLASVDSHIFVQKMLKWNLRFLWVFEHPPFISWLAPTSSCPCCCCWCSCHQRRPSKAWPHQSITCVTGILALRSALFLAPFWWTCCESVKALRVETWIDMGKFIFSSKSLECQTPKSHRSHFKWFKRESVQDTQMPPHHFFLVLQCFGLSAKLQPPTLPHHPTSPKTQCQDMSTYFISAIWVSASSVVMWNTQPFAFFGRFEIGIQTKPPKFDDNA